MKRLASYLVISFVAASGFADAATGIVHRVYQCPSPKIFHEYLVKGKPVSLCPLNETDHTGKATCKIKLHMHPLLDGYGGYPPNKGFKVVEARGYFHHQCHYLVQIPDSEKSRITYGHFLIDDHIGEYCYRSSKQKGVTTFYCELPLSQQYKFRDDGRRL